MTSEIVMTLINLGVIAGLLAVTAGLLGVLRSLRRARDSGEELAAWIHDANERAERWLEASNKHLPSR